MYDILRLIQAAPAIDAARIERANHRRLQAATLGRVGAVSRLRHGVGHRLIAVGHRVAHGNPTAAG